MDNLYLIKYNNTVIGAYTSYKLAEIFILSCFQNNLMKNSAIILIIKTNSCYCINTKIIYESNNNIVLERKKPFIDIDKNYNPVYENNEKDMKINNINLENAKIKLETIGNKKNNLQHKINIIKYNNEKQLETKKIYEIDIELFKKFLDNQLNDPLFTIPDLFKEKFNVFKKLFDNNNLSYETFFKEYYNKYNYTYLKYNEDSSDEEKKNSLNIIEEFHIS